MTERLHEPPAQARRNRWSTPVAALAVALHFGGGLAVLGWYYVVVPHWKHELDDIGMELSEPVRLLIVQGDLVVSYGPIFLALAVPLLVLDFIVVRWIARQIGLRCAVAIVLLALLLQLANMIFGEQTLRHAKAKAIGQTATASPARLSNTDCHHKSSCPA